MKKRGEFRNCIWNNSNKKGQVWVETVTYTLIAFVMIGLVLSFAKPKIEEIQDKILTEQSIKMLKEIDSIISEVSEEGIGNKRKLELGLKKGSLELIPSEDLIVFTMESKYIYSQPEEEYVEGILTILTEEKGSYNDLTIKVNYSSTYNLTFNLEEFSKTITKASTTYNLFISNEGGDPKVINFEVE